MSRARTRTVPAVAVAAAVAVAPYALVFKYSAWDPASPARDGLLLVVVLLLSSFFVPMVFALLGKSRPDWLWGLAFAVKARKDEQELGPEGDPTKWRRLFSLGALGGVAFLVGVALLVTSLALAVWSQALFSG